jgi:hypothetical protein
MTERYYSKLTPTMAAADRLACTLLTVEVKRVAYGLVKHNSLRIKVYAAVALLVSKATSVDGAITV